MGRTKRIHFLVCSSVLPSERSNLGKLEASFLSVVAVPETQ